MRKWPVITTIPQFCVAIGWPTDALDGMKFSEVLSLLALYDLTVDFVCRERDPLFKCGDSPCGRCASCTCLADGTGY